MDNPKKKETKTYTFEMAKVFSIAFEMGFIIALPIVILELGGKWLDNKYHINIFVYLAIPVSLLVSGTWLYARLAELAKRLEEASKGPKQDEQAKPDFGQKKNSEKEKEN